MFDAAEARRLALRLAGGRRSALDIQRVFAWFPPERRLGEGLLRLAEAFPRTPDREGRRRLVDEFLHPLMPLLPVDLGTRFVARQFVYAPSMARALERAGKNTRNAFSFDMLGEGARTDADALRNLRHYEEAIHACAGNPRHAVSIKLSSIHPRHDAQGFLASREAISRRLLGLCNAAERQGVPLTIDAEESERLPMQLGLFATMAQAFPAWTGLGIAVQAYLRGVTETLERVIAIARQRGAPLNVRLVKGAYWDAELKRAQELGLEGYPVFTEKGATDRAYVSAAELLLAHAGSVFPQFATHNPATAACVLALAAKGSGTFEFQRLHGMGEPLDAALAREAPQVPVRIYAPVGERHELLAYLVRRLIENSASTSYVRQAARSASPRDVIEKAFESMEKNATTASFPPPRDLHMPERRTARGFNLADPEELAAMAHAVKQARRAWKAPPDASPEEVKAAIAAAHGARHRWAATDVGVRAAALERLADLLEASLHELMALCVWEAGKTLPDALADVREAVDFCRYYASEARRAFQPIRLRGPVGETNVLTFHGRGVFACISPWNFPVAIFTGQVAAALVAGNTVVAKPAEQTPMAAARVAELILEAGVPRDVFRLVAGDGKVGAAIVEDERIAGVVFTGSTQVARSIHRALAAKEGPIVPFIAETGGLNAMIVDSTALPEQVADAVLSSAFRSAGQRCSSLRMLYLQEEIAPAVIEMLRGAMAALRVGDPADPGTDVGPVIDAEAKRGLQEYVSTLRKRFSLIGEAESLKEGNFVAPVAFEVEGIRDLPGERFGPVLHVARFRIEDLDRVVDDINAMGYGLTMGVHTRLDSRWEHIRRRAAVGNLYVNRNIIGAMVGVQPFGGEGLSGTGPKAGGPGYLARFAVERVCTVNTAAAGGDLRLLTGTG